MSKKLTETKLKMAALGNHMMEAGAEIYSNPEVRREIKSHLKEKETKK
jgi:hypothetical protein